MDVRGRLAARWPLTGGALLREQLLRAWSDPGRGYHDLVHLEEVLDRLDELADGVAFDGITLALAAWFHDAVYDGQPGAEERSALLAERSLPEAGAPDRAEEVARLVRLTAHHRPEPGDVAGEVLTDADLAILAAAPDRYAAYVAGVRREYADVPEDRFRAGRAAVLADLAAKPHLFHTAYGRAVWEPTARANLERELAALTG